LVGKSQSLDRDKSSCLSGVPVEEAEGWKVNPFPDFESSMYEEGEEEEGEEGGGEERGRRGEGGEGERGRREESIQTFITQ